MNVDFWINSTLGAALSKGESSLELFKPQLCPFCLLRDHLLWSVKYFSCMTSVLGDQTPL